MTFDVILQNYLTRDIKRVTVCGYKDINDVVNHCVNKFPMFSIEDVSEVYE